MRWTTWVVGRHVPVPRLNENKAQHQLSVMWVSLQKLSSFRRGRAKAMQIACLPLEIGHLGETESVLRQVSRVRVGLRVS